MKSNTLTIIKKEYARFFGDKSLVFTSVIMPGLLIYLIYSLMGDGIGKIISEGANEEVTLQVENMPQSLEAMITEADSAVKIIEQPFGEEEVSLLEDKDLNMVMLRFPENFDSTIATYDPSTGELAPNVEIFHNSTNNASERVYQTLTAMLTMYENGMSNRFDVNRIDCEVQQPYDLATDEEKGAMIWSKLLPMLIVMMLFSGTMAIAPSAIAGEKERGTIATLLVTPMRRNELALGKIVSLSSIALLSGISSFIGIALSLPKMLNTGDDVNIGFNYGVNDYIALLIVIIATVLVMASMVSILSALAKDVKNAGTLITPFMLVIMLCGLLPMMQSGVSENLAVYCIPFYNSIEVMAGVLGHELNWNAVMTTLISNLAYTGIAVWGLTRMFNSEKIMFGK